LRDPPRDGGGGCGGGFRPGRAHGAATKTVLTPIKGWMRGAPVAPALVWTDGEEVKLQEEEEMLYFTSTPKRFF